MTTSPSSAATGQSAQILKALKGGRSLTALDALKEFGVFRLAARIRDLRQLGYSISSTMVYGDDGKRFALYALDGQVDDQGQWSWELEAKRGGH